MTARTTHAPSGRLEVLFWRFREHGEASAIAAVYDLTAVELLSIATHLCRDAADAEDALQATFLTALESADAWQSDRPLMPWLIGILSNRVRRQRRSASSRPEPERLSASEVAAPLEEIESREFTCAVDQAIARLPRALQSVLVLRLKHGMSTGDIACAVRRPPGTVRAQLSRGMQMLRKILPPVFAGLLATMVLPTRGLAAIKSLVLERASSMTTPSVLAASYGGLRLWMWCGLLAVTVTLAALAYVGPALPQPTARVEAQQPEGPVRGEHLERTELTSPREFPQELEFPQENAERVLADVSHGGSLVVALLHDGQPAYAAPVRLEFLGRSPSVWATNISDRWGVRRILEPIAHQAHPGLPAGLTNESGTCRFDELDAGFWLLHVPGKSGVVSLRESQVTNARAELGDAVTALHGIVRGTAGLPIPGAEIWAGDADGQVTTRQALQTDADGRFSTYVASGSLVEARRAGLRPAAYCVLAKAPSEIELILHDGGVSVVGVVRDTAGHGLENATVELGTRQDLRIQPGRDSPSTGDGDANIVGVPLRVTTDGSGAFRVEGIDPGRLMIRAWHPTYGARTVAADAAAGNSVPVQIELGGVGEIHGSVTDRDRQPLPGVRVFVQDSRDKLSTSTDSEGHFTLTGLPVGPTKLIAEEDGQGHATTVLTIKANEAIEWHPVLSPDDMRITGCVSAPGRRSRRFVVVRDDSQRMDVTRTDERGEFSFDVPQFRLGRLSTLLVYEDGDVKPDGQAKRFCLTRESSVQAGRHDVQLRVPANLQLTASITGTLTADHPEHLGSIQLQREAPGDNLCLPTRLKETGAPTRIAADGLPPGHYRLLANKHQIDEFQLIEGQQLDLGMVTITKPVLTAPADDGLPGRLLAFVEPENHTLVGRLSVSIWSEHGDLLGWHMLPRSQGAWRLSLRLPAGTYQVRATGEQSLVATQTLQIDEQGSSYAIRVQLSER